MPLYLAWEKQGKVHWDEEWIKQNGPVRQRIPGLDDHISFANFDLKNNGLPLIQTADSGRPFAMCFKPMTETELSELQAAVITHFDHPWQADECLKEIGSRLAAVAGLLDVVAYHGFAPATRTPGLDHLNMLLPRQELQRVDHDKQDPPHGQ